MSEQVPNKAGNETDSITVALPQGWQPISTAPKGGIRIQLMRVKMPKFQNLPDILWIKVGSWRAHYQDSYTEGWREDAVAAPIPTDHLKLSPSHWMPIPEPPVLP